jgi:hypothetical protein
MNIRTVLASVLIGSVLGTAVGVGSSMITHRLHKPVPTVEQPLVLPGVYTVNIDGNVFEPSFKYLPFQIAVSVKSKIPGIPDEEQLFVTDGGSAMLSRNQDGWVRLVFRGQKVDLTNESTTQSESSSNQEATSSAK